MNTKLTLSVDQKVIEEIKLYAKLASAIVQARASQDIISAKMLTQISSTVLYQGTKIQPNTCRFS